MQDITSLDLKITIINQIIKTLEKVDAHFGRKMVIIFSMIFDEAVKKLKLKKPPLCALVKDWIMNPTWTSNLLAKERISILKKIKFIKAHLIPED